MQEITISGARKITLRQYESKDKMCAVKIQVLDGCDLKAECEKLNEKVEAFLDEWEKKARAQVV